MKYIYTAVFYKTEDEKQYYAKVPDLPGCVSKGYGLSDAIDQITDAMNGWLVNAEDENLPIPVPSPQRELELEEGGEIAYVRADTLAYRERTESRSVRKNVSLPAWMVRLADKQHINCSQVLQEALRCKLEDLK